MDKYTVTIDKIEAIKDIGSNALFIKMSEKEYSTQSGWGFSTLTLYNDLISGCILKKTAKKYFTWDEASNSLISKTYDIIKEFRFFVDLKRSFMAVEGGLKDLNLLKQALRQICWSEFMYPSFSNKIGDYLSKFHNDGTLYEIEELTLSDFKIKNLFMGVYTARIIGENVGITQISEYLDAITKFKVSLNIKEHFVKLSASKCNSFVVVCEDSCRMDVLEYLTSIVI
ncbi:MAG: hypothetical protein NC453_16005 [Muribaculum sp.]|nr:hypothetical protein [Muribaculum sp.]